MKWPTFISQSNFLEKVQDGSFGFTKSRDDYHRYLNKFMETIPDSKNNLQAINFKHSTHNDFGDNLLF